MKVVLSKKSYWKSVLFLGLKFIVIFSILEYVFNYGWTGFKDVYTNIFAYGQWKRFILSRLVGGLLYGMILGFYFHNKQLKEQL
ncbi:hypothetical protein NBT05_08425 [Aquimarina sp. ERC-38]|uniref:hypothetical protein n=1 Tax=Aquimarina sp. ERC-38 TaxID=2949996 RepID=UPI0022465B99|nr:hypothetical protein [Aquimarina sp. ERC-38]UZO82487.1 hypothetical protein NBT05_08425 [Aquimarina sp. ERC-38]